MAYDIKYRVNHRKAIEAIVWLATEKPGIDIYHIAKVLFYAEKQHINRYARPIIGDTYKSGDAGPFPSVIRDLIYRNEQFLSLEIIQQLDRAIITEKTPYPTPKPLRESDIDYFSETDIECLTESLNKYGDMSFEDLKQLTHEEKSYYGTDPNKDINYALMIDDDNPYKEEIYTEILETSPYVQM